MRGAWRLRQVLGAPKGMLDRQRARRATARALRAVAIFPLVRDHEPHGLSAPLVVSLTSYPPRFPTLALTLRSLLDQRTKADRTILWVTPEDLLSLPPEVLALRGSGLEIATARNLRSYKKLVPALESFSGCVIVTADDDVYYAPDWLTRLVSASKARPSAVVGLRCHMARTDETGRFLPYGSWDLETKATESNHDEDWLFPTGVGGILYPPGVLLPDVCNEERFMRLCPSADDIWFFWMARLIGTKHYRVPGTHDVVTWPASQEVALFRTNLIEGTGNDEAIRALEAEFGLIS